MLVTLVFLNQKKKIKDSIRKTFFQLYPLISILTRQLIIQPGARNTRLPSLLSSSTQNKQKQIKTRLMERSLHHIATGIFIDTLARQLIIQPGPKIFANQKCDS